MDSFIDDISMYAGASWHNILITIFVASVVIYFLFIRRYKCLRKYTTFDYNYTDKINKINELITTDAGNRGMKHLVVPGDLLSSAEILARVRNTSYDARTRPEIVILTGFPCCVDHTPPQETDGLSSVAIAHACMNLGYNVTLITEECNESIFRAAVKNGVDPTVFYPNPMHRDVPSQFQDKYANIKLYFVKSPSLSKEDKSKLKELVDSTDLIIACERAGPSADGNCYTMSGINMTKKGLIAPQLHNFVSDTRKQGSEGMRKFIAIGDGGNELGMGKVMDKVYEHIRDGKKIGAVNTLDGKNLAADSLIAASVSNWGAYALIAAAALVRAHDVKDWSYIKRCLPTEKSEKALMYRCVAAGCRDGVSGKKEATVDGMPLEKSMECLREIRKIALG